MAVRIRLRRVGRKKQPSYRVVIADRAAARDGSYIEAIGFYNPRMQPAELRLDLARVDYWLGQGAEPSTTVHDLILKARKGGDTKVALVTAQPEPATTPPPSKRPRPGRKAAAEGTPGNEAAASGTADGAEAPAAKKASKPGSRGRGKSAGEATADVAAEAAPAPAEDSVDGTATAGTDEVAGGEAGEAAASETTTEATSELAAAEAAAETDERSAAEEAAADEEKEKE